VLFTESTVDPDDNFWVVDACVGCGTNVKYKGATQLD